MLTISVELLHGTFRGDSSGAANTGRLTRGEWPPSPARLFAALVAADGTGSRCRVTDGTELIWFERLPPPTISADASAIHHQPLEPRYVVRHKGSASKAFHQEYVGRTGALTRPGVRVSPRCPQIFYSWDVEPPTPSVLQALRRRAARVGYLGCSDSPVRIRIFAHELETSGCHEPFVPDKQGTLAINVPCEGYTDMLDHCYDMWVSHGASVSRQQFPALLHGARYRDPKPQAPSGNGKVVVWLRLGNAISGRRVAAVTQLFKEAVLSNHQRIFGEPPAVLHGHGFEKQGYDLARFLALPDVGLSLVSRAHSRFSTVDAFRLRRNRLSPSSRRGTCH